jgi:hypothetical protein
MTWQAHTHSTHRAQIAPAGWLASRHAALLWFAITQPLMVIFGLVHHLTCAAMGSLLRNWLVQGARLPWFNRAMAAGLVANAAWMGTL